ncbi:hypothetical protein E2C01_073176 [Portunus trituberculatus]|uniref:Uncharacterized protein n=1 Tax=Portunus trituberculatus TaxID=210409 RepID=A0A5B7I4I0_PORTR|nr:hypothetical protein [Portunus trituberculatus]
MSYNTHYNCGRARKLAQDEGTAGCGTGPSSATPPASQPASQSHSHATEPASSHVTLTGEGHTPPRLQDPE